MNLDYFNNYKTVLILTALLGFSLGSSMFILTYQESSYCESLDDQIKQEKDFNGSVACYNPDSLKANITERVENNSELQCVCRVIQVDGSIQILPVASSN